MGRHSVLGSRDPSFSHCSAAGCEHGGVVLGPSASGMTEVAAFGSAVRAGGRDVCGCVIFQPSRPSATYYLALGHDYYLA